MNTYHISIQTNEGSESVASVATKAAALNIAVETRRTGGSWAKDFAPFQNPRVLIHLNDGDAIYDQPLCKRAMKANPSWVR